MLPQGKLYQLLIGASLLVAVFTLARFLPWFTTTPGLILMNVVGCGVLYWRWRHHQRVNKPEVRADFKKIQTVDLHKMKPWIFKNIMGQGQPMQAIFNLLKRNLELAQPGRHLGSFLLVGPTGTGKAFFAQLLAEGLYGPGTLLSIPVNQGGLNADKVSSILLTALKQNPHRVVLFDEIDKANAEVRGALYHFIENGQMMDPANGEWFSCPGCVVIATTNAGAQSVDAARLGAESHYGMLDHIAANSSIEKALLSRFEGMFWFGPLAAIDVAQITIMQLMRYYKQHGIEVKFLCPEAIVQVVKENQRFREFGVRQLMQVARHRADPLIAEARQKGLRELQIITDEKGQFVAQSSRVVRKVA
jgi:ATP-dependent Clp protease ATP-binding subunit ClpA